MTAPDVARTDSRAQRKLLSPQVSLCDVALESGTLGAALLCQSHAAELIRNGTPELFTCSFARDIFTAIRSLGADSLDYSLLAHELARNGKDVDWAALTGLDDGVVIEIAMAKRIARLRELHRLRQLARLGEWLADAPFGVGVKSCDLIAEVHERVEEISR
jgi:hypothetical protein